MSVFTCVPHTHVIKMENKAQKKSPEETSVLFRFKRFRLKKNKQKCK